ncbi:MAG: chromate resistance protein ChrB domain-containing protein, partial [Burkholderiales bacterium]
VRGADTARLDIAPQAAGLLAISLGLSRNFTDDHEMLKHGIVLHDALYAWCRDCQAQTHGWQPKA